MSNKIFFRCIIFFSGFIISCNYSDDNPNISPYLDELKDSTNRKDGKMDSIFYNDITQQLKLDESSLVGDDVKIRILYDYALAPHRSNLIILLRKAARWHGELITYKQSPESRFKKVVHTSVSPIAPKSGWNYLIKKLFENNIHSLPSAVHIGGYVSESTDGSRYTVEFITKDFHRAYSYLRPCEVRGIGEAKMMCKIISLLDEQLPIKHLSED